MIAMRAVVVDCIWLYSVAYRGFEDLASAIADKLFGISLAWDDIMEAADDLLRTKALEVVQ